MKARTAVTWTFRLVVVVLYFATAWIAGLVILFVVLPRVFRRIVQLRLALSPTIRCPWCRALVPQYGTYSCLSCRSRTLGWAWQCRTCRTWAGHIRCECGLSVQNPLLGAP